MTRKSISTSHVPVSCTICGRTLLRGETADVFLHGGSRRAVCELCVGRAVHEGWIREGIDGEFTNPRREGGAGRGLLTRLRTRRDAHPARRSREDEYASPPPDLAPSDGWELDLPDETPAPPAEPAAPPPAAIQAADPVDLAPPDALIAAQPLALPEVDHDAFAEAFQPQEPRNVHAIPSNADLKVTRALEVFNASHHPRTVSGVARSLGAPMVSAHPSLTEGSIVSIVVAWDLSWYRYEIDLGDEAAGVRLIAQGDELDELDDLDRQANATADERGRLHPAPGLA